MLAAVAGIATLPAVIARYKIIKVIFAQAVIYDLRFLAVNEGQKDRFFDEYLLKIIRIDNIIPGVTDLA